MVQPTQGLAAVSVVVHPGVHGQGGPDGASPGQDGGGGGVVLGVAEAEP